MSRGPLPKPGARRRNAPTITGTVLPAGGYEGEIPECPYELLGPGAAWWAWAWRTPQAATFSDGALYALARRAKLEDDLAQLGALEEFDWAGLLGAGDEAVRTLEALVRRLKGLAGGSVSLMKEMRELDKRFGLDPKALAENRWTIAEPEPEPEAAAPAAVRKLRAIDPAA